MAVKVSSLACPKRHKIRGMKMAHLRDRFVAIEAKESVGYGMATGIVLIRRGVNVASFGFDFV